MWKKTKLIFLSSVLAFSVTCTTTHLVALAEDNTKSQITENISENFLKVKFENKVLFHEQVPSKTIIQIRNVTNEILKSEVLSSDMELELVAPKVEKGKILSYWSIEKKENKLLITPVFISEKEMPVKFMATEGGKLLENNVQTNEIVKSVTKRTNLKDILPEVNPKEDYKFSGWFEKEEKITDIDDRKVMNAQGNYYAKFFADFNDNNIDDRTEKISVKFVTNSDEKFKDINTDVGTQFTIPQLKKKDHIFVGWYKDKEYNEKFTEDVLTESLTLYAKWEKADKVINEARKTPITDKNISDQVQRMMNERVNTPRTPNSASDTPINQSKINSSELVNQSAQSSYDGNTGSSFKETVYVFNNKNLDQEYMVKFFGNDGKFLSSIILPYGRTIKLLDENAKPHEEYSIRQDTTITINTEDYINEGSIFLGFDTSEVRVNSTQITEVFPRVDVVANKKELEHQQEMLASAALEKENAKRKTMLFTSVGGGIAVALIGLGAYVVIRRKRRTKDPIIEKESA